MKWTARIKEVGNDHILTPTIIGDHDREYVMKFWGLGQYDYNHEVEWFELEVEE